MNRADRKRRYRVPESVWWWLVGLTDAFYLITFGLFGVPLVIVTIGLLPITIFAPFGVKTRHPIKRFAFACLYGIAVGVPVTAIIAVVWIENNPSCPWPESKCDAVAAGLLWVSLVLVVIAIGRTIHLTRRLNAGGPVDG